MLVTTPCALNPWWQVTAYGIRQIKMVRLCLCGSACAAKAFRLVSVYQPVPGALQKVLEQMHETVVKMQSDGPQRVCVVLDCLSVSARPGHSLSCLALPYLITQEVLLCA